MTRSTTSLRLDDHLRERLAARAETEGTSLTAVVERILREGLATDQHPGIVFKPGPSGRRAALAGGPDVWEIASALRRMTGSESERIAALAEEFDLHARQVVIALNYAAANPDEIEARVRANDKGLEEVERIAARRKHLFA
jgi:plasmid stability protein